MQNNPILTTALLPQDHSESMKEKPDIKETSEKAVFKCLQDEMKCSICWRYMYRCVTLIPCLHNFCSFCLSEYLNDNYWRMICPTCRGEIGSWSKNLFLNNLADCLNTWTPEFQVSIQEKEIMDQRDLILKGAKLKKYDDRSVYFGCLKDEQREGKGKFMDSLRNEYEGEFKNDRFEGQGNLNCSNGERYSGEWKNGRKHGFGEMIYSNGVKYKGEWKNDLRCGSGEMKWVFGDVYKGEFKDDKREGKGEYTFSTGDKLKGEMRNDSFEGFGEIIFADGGKYKGGLKNSKREGQGENYYSKGDFYKGEWKNDLRHGFGEYTYANGTKEVGEWRDNMFCGPKQVDNKKVEEACVSERKERRGYLSRIFLGNRGSKSLQNVKN